MKRLLPFSPLRALSLNTDILERNPGLFYIYQRADIAQLVEQRTRNAWVVGSIPIVGTNNVRLSLMLVSGFFAKRGHTLGRIRKKIFPKEHQYDFSMPK